MRLCTVPIHQARAAASLTQSPRHALRSWGWSHRWSWLVQKTIELTVFAGPEWILLKAIQPGGALDQSQFAVFFLFPWAVWILFQGGLQVGRVSRPATFVFFRLLLATFDLDLAWCTRKAGWISFSSPLLLRGPLFKITLENCKVQGDMPLSRFLCVGVKSFSQEQIISFLQKQPSV